MYPRFENAELSNGGGEPSIFLLPILFATKIKGGAKELLVLILLGGNI